MSWKNKTVEEDCCAAQAPALAAKADQACSEGACEIPRSPANGTACPVSGTAGLKIDLITLKALLRPAALRRLDGKQYRFCPAADCNVVYFDNEAGSVFAKSDLTVRVGAKEKSDPIPICYCFNFTVEDIRRDLANRGRAEIPAFITREVQAGHCACEVKNPQGSCCLGNVAKAVQRIRLAKEKVG